jgi:phosphatidylinositol alpha-1,6-mannosyltransferase
LRSLHAGGLLARAGLVERITLSPEGSDLAAMCRLTRVLLARGTRLLTLSYHSPSLEPGHTPYVRNERDLAIFLDRLSGFLSFFRYEIGGEFLTLADLRMRLLPDGAMAAPAPAQAAPVGAQAIPPAPDNRSRCLIVANTFPPVVGGSAVAYDNQARFAQGRISVLAPYDDYRNGWPTIGWREYDRTVPYPIHRIRLLRTPLLPDAPSAIQRLVAAARDVAIRISVLRAIRRIGRAENIDVVCIGELVASGWLATACRVLLRLKSLIYIHGEEISTRMSYDEMGRRRRRAISRTDGVVAVSPFTRGMLMTMMGVPEAKIQLITPGIDVRRFSPRPPRADLVARYGIAGKIVLLTVGRLFARKGMDRVIESLPQIRPVIENICYLVVGDGPYRSVLEDLAARHGVKDAVVFAGTVPENELIDHYALADIFVMANREMPDGDTEGFGLVFLEANACGIPVIAGKAGGSVDAVTDLRNGLVVDGRDPADITAAVIRLCQNDTLRAQLRETGLEIAADASWESRSDLLLGFCDQLIASKR